MCRNKREIAYIYEQCEQASGEAFRMSNFIRTIKCLHYPSISNAENSVCICVGEATVHPAKHCLHNLFHIIRRKSFALRYSENLFTCAYLKFYHIKYPLLREIMPTYNENCWAKGIKLPSYISICLFHFFIFSPLVLLLNRSLPCLSFCKVVLVAHALVCHCTVQQHPLSHCNQIRIKKWK